MKLLIDTNAYVALMRGDEAVAEALDQAEKVYLSAIVSGELLAGFRAAPKERENRARLRDFIRDGGKTELLPVGFETAERFALIQDSLARRGRSLPLDRIWIAAHCQETGALLLTYDPRFFEIEGLLIWEGCERP